MITPKLEDWILCGKAEYKQWTHGGSGVGTIPVPTKSYIVLVDLIWHPFNDFLQEILLNNPGTANFFNNIASCKQLQLRDASKNVNFTFRDYIEFHAFTDAGLLTPTEIMPAQKSPYQIHCFHKFTESVRIDIIHVPANTFWQNGDFVAMDDQSNEDQKPNGYGTASFAGDTVLRSWLLDAGNKIVDPAGFIRNPNIPAGTRKSEQFHADYVTGASQSFLSDATGRPNNYSYPLITFGYVEIKNPSND